MTKTTDSDTEVSGNPSTTPARVPRTIFLKFFNGLLSDSSGFLPCPTRLQCEAAHINYPPIRATQGSGAWWCAIWRAVRHCDNSQRSRRGSRARGEENREGDPAGRRDRAAPMMMLKDAPGGADFIDRCVAAAADIWLRFVGADDERLGMKRGRCKGHYRTMGSRL